MPEPIEATYTEEQAYTPSVAPTGLSRADVLTQLRQLMAEANGVAALVEQHVSELRREFTTAWRAWYGIALGRHIYLERVPFDLAATDAEVMRWQQRLAAWRAGLSAELSSQQPAPPQGAPTDAAPQTIAPPATNARRGWPTWAVWLGVGGGVLLAWKVGQWLFGPSYTTTSQVVADVAQTADAVNDVRKNRRAA